MMSMSMILMMIKYIYQCICTCKIVCIEIQGITGNVKYMGSHRELQGFTGNNME